MERSPWWCEICEICEIYEICGADRNVMRISHQSGVLRKRFSRFCLSVSRPADATSTVGDGACRSCDGGASAEGRSAASQGRSEPRSGVVRYRDCDRSTRHNPVLDDV